MNKIALIICILAIVALAPQTEATIVELPLDAAGVYGWSSGYWETDFDLGVTFSDISNVYIDWSGEIMAATVKENSGDDPFPIDIGIMAVFGGNATHHASVHAGEATYPQAEPFAEMSEFMLTGLDTWNDLLDCKGTLFISPDYPASSNTMGYIEYGYIQLDMATLVVEGAVVPEPATFALFVLGAAFVSQTKRRR